MRSAIDRVARIAYAFVVLNLAAVKGLGAFVTGREVWR